jgi:hypothetical protein
MMCPLNAIIDRVDPTLKKMNNVDVDTPLPPQGPPKALVVFFIDVGSPIASPTKSHVEDFVDFGPQSHTNPFRGEMNIDISFDDLHLEVTT